MSQGTTGRYGVYWSTLAQSGCRFSDDGLDVRRLWGQVIGLYRMAVDLGQHAVARGPSSLGKVAIDDRDGHLGAKVTDRHLRGCLFGFSNEC